MAWDSSVDIPDLSRKVAVVTGGNTGLGKECVRQLVVHNAARVYIAARSEARAKAAIDDLARDHPDFDVKSKVVYLHMDLENLRCCQAAAREFLGRETRLDILINNAGIMATPYKLTKDGIEAQFQVNHLGHFAFILPLIPLLINTSQTHNPVRIVTVSSIAHLWAPSVKFDSLASVNRNFGSTWLRYGQAKLANILFAKELSRRMKGYEIYSNAVHPGPCATEIHRGTVSSYPWMLWFAFLYPIMVFFMSTVRVGARGSLYAATDPDVEKKNMRGVYLVPYTSVSNPSSRARNEQMAKDLWTLSEALVKEKTGQLA